MVGIRVLPGIGSNQLALLTAPLWPTLQRVSGILAQNLKVRARHPEVQRLLPVVTLVRRDDDGGYCFQVLARKLLVSQVEAFERVLDLVVVAERVLGVNRVQERREGLHVGLDAVAVGDAALHGVYRQSHQAEVPVLV